MFLIIDNYDSFVYNLVRYLEELDEDVLIKRNDKITLEEIENLNLDGIIISPGPKAPKDVPFCLEVIDRFKGKIPILGICLGHQCIGHYFECSIVRAEYPVHGKIHEIVHDNLGIFKNIKNPLNVTRYHSLKIDEKSIPKDIVVTARTKEGVIMGIRHKFYNIEGIQFHPEAHLTECGHAMFENFIKKCKKGDKVEF